MLINFCDSAFAIGESAVDKNIRYLKQIKQRNTQQIYDADNVCLCQIIKPHNFLQFEFLTYGFERDHLKELASKDQENKIQLVKELSNQGKSQRQIAQELGMALGTVNKYLNK
jgi:Trp operon repressor